MSENRYNHLSFRYLFSLVQIFIFLICIIFLSFPIIIWAYIFSYVDEKKIERTRFLYGIFLGAAALFPLLFLEKITTYISWIDVLSLFARAEGLMDFSISTVLFIIFVSLLFLYSLFFSRSLHHIQEKIYSLLLVICIVVIISLILFGVSLAYIYIPSFQSIQVFDFPSFQGIWFDTAFLIILYYFIVATIEEVSKYFMSLHNQKSEDNHSLSYMLLGALFVGLGFAFVENIFYTYRFLSQGFSGVFGVMIFRSIFSTLLHVICTVTFFFGSLYLLSGKTHIRGKYILSSVLFGFLAICFHTFYNMSLAYGYLGVVIFAIIAGYFYLSYLFTRS